MNVKKFTVDAQPTDPRSSGWCMRMRMPSFVLSSALTPRDSWKGSSTRAPRRNEAEATNDAASARIASGAVNTCTSTPASDGPATYATARLVESLPLATSTCSRGTVAVKNELYDRSKNTAQEPTRKTTMYSCSSESASNAAASGIDASSTARAMSATTITRRLTGRASTQTPTGSENTRCGSQKSAVSSPISVALACNMSTAASGIASALIWSPKTETDTDAHRRRNAVCRWSGGR